MCEKINGPFYRSYGLKVFVGLQQDSISSVNAYIVISLVIITGFVIQTSCLCRWQLQNALQDIKNFYSSTRYSTPPLPGVIVVRPSDQTMSIITLTFHCQFLLLVYTL